MKNLILIFILVVLSKAFYDRGLKIYKQKYQNEKKVALVIGNSKYDNSKFVSLQNPVNDARSMRDVLKNLGFEVLYLENATNKQMKKMVKKFKSKLKNSGVGFFYYAGHGIQVDNKNYLIATDSDIEDKEDVEFASLALDYVVKNMQSSNDRLNIVVLDACRTDPFSRGDGGGLAPIDNAKGFFIAYATAPGETASDGNGEHGVFTKYIIKNIVTPNEPIEQIFKKVRTDVLQATNEKQIPWTSSSITGDFYFKIDTNYKQKSFISFEDTIPDKYALTIHTTPLNAKVYITNIKFRYYDGIMLKPGKYNIKVVADGYYTKNGVIYLKSDTEINISLKKIKKSLISSNNSSNLKDKVWIDPDTGFMWQVDIPKKRYNWWDSKSYCKNLNLSGYNDWRLPSIDELKTILTKNYYRSLSTINRAYIKKELLNSIYELKNPIFWSSTPYVSFFEKGLIVYFNNGCEHESDKSDTYYVRCVRGKKFY